MTVKNKQKKQYSESFCETRPYSLSVSGVVCLHSLKTFSDDLCAFVV